MKLRQQLFILAFLMSATGFSQIRTFAFSQIQVRNENRQWGNTQYVGSQLAQFSDSKIDVHADRDYHLKIISKTDLPDNGVIYLCQDEKSNAVTVMLIDNVRMYLYSQTKRFLINFDAFASHALMANRD